MTTSLPGSRNSVVMLRAWEVVALEEAGPRARLRGRCERGSAEVGMLSGIGSDMVSWMSDCARLKHDARAQEAHKCSVFGRGHVWCLSRL
jgi:hypothetical protein